MEFAGGEDLFEAFDRRCRCALRQIGVDIGLEAVAEEFRDRNLIDFRHLHIIDDLCPLALHVGQRCVDQFDDLRVGIGAGEELPQYTNPGAFEPVGIEESEIAVRPFRLRLGGYWIGWVSAGYDIENRHCVGQRSRHRSADVTRQKQWHDAVAAGQPHCRADADQAGVRRWPAD